MTDRFSRQHDLVPRDRLKQTSAMVIGVGAIGRQVALQLAAIGVPELQLIDFDLVEASNVTTQGYHQTDPGMPKVQATAAAVHRIDPQVKVTLHEDRYRPRQGVAAAVFCCVDSIGARAAIFRSVNRGCRFWCDGRMLGEVIRIVTATETDGFAGYEQTLFPQREAQQGTCTSRSTIYAAGIAAGLMLHMFSRWLRNLPLDRDLSLNLLAGELCCAG